MKDFNNKTVWITGASSGIGEAIAEAFAARGARLILSARKQELLEQVAARCRTLGAPQVWVQPLDLADSAHLSEIADSIVQSAGPVDVLVNNGGISQRGTVSETSMEVYRRLMEVNLFGAIAITKAVLPQMQQRRQGQIIVISSLAGKMGPMLRSGYAASKHALHGFFDCLRAEESGHNIKVLMVCPGYIHTDISVNALSADGRPTGKMDDNQARGMPASVLAKKIIKALAQQKEEIYVGGKEVIGVYLKRFFPALLSRIIRKRGNA